MFAISVDSGKAAEPTLIVPAAAEGAVLLVPAASGSLPLLPQAATVRRRASVTVVTATQVLCGDLMVGTLSLCGHVVVVDCAPETDKHRWCRECRQVFSRV